MSHHTFDESPAVGSMIGLLSEKLPVWHLTRLLHVAPGSLASVAEFAGFEESLFMSCLLSGAIQPGSWEFKSLPSRSWRADLISAHGQHGTVLLWRMLLPSH